MLSNSSKLHKIIRVLGVLGWVFAGFILAQAIGIGALWGLQALGVSVDLMEGAVFTTVTSAIIYGLMVMIIVGIPQRLKKWHSTLESVGLSRWPQWKDLLYLLAGVGVYIVLTLVINVTSRLLLPNANYDEVQQIGFTALTQNWEFLLAFLSLVVVAPVAEEVIFRGYLLGKIRKYAPAWGAVVLSAALFAVAHGQFNVALDTFALGVVLAVLRLKTGSLWPAIFLHALKNAVAFYFLFVNPLII